MYVNLLKQRRSVFDINKDASLSKNEIVKMLKEIIHVSPTSFNGQSTKVVLLWDKESNKLWEHVKEYTQGKIAPHKLPGFLNAQGTVLFYVDEEILQPYTQKTQLPYQEVLNFAREDSAILQVNVWNALTELNLGANLQHYNDAVNDYFKNNPKFSKLKLLGQMPFGAISSAPQSKEKLDVDQRIIVL
ncbi:nitroreductase family protein [Mycoplasmopsis columboralis]|uniref:Nitroreductase domain-containing protein n=1 Tax=Mycoplasmopsis columboralis TaxID=171282 RepID=A0A449B7B4_9BACT|nr:nitroreductase family protein [Mycoplasmopsis columboralis]VEU76477.1 Uncharacterised protein [Mycoplasmopsis columboralis]